MKSLPESESIVNHFFRLGNNFGTTSKTSEIIENIAVITLNRNSMLLTDNVFGLRQNFRKSIPRVCVKSTALEMFYFFVQSSECFRRPRTRNPCYHFIFSPIISLDYPKFAFFYIENATINQILFLLYRFLFHNPAIFQLLR